MNALTPFEPKPAPVLTASDDRLFDSLQDLKDLLVRRRLALLGCMASCVLLGLAYLAVTPPSYTASATLMVDGEHTDVVHQQPSAVDAQILNAMVESEVEVLHSPGLAREVVDRLGLVADPSFVAAVPSSSATMAVGSGGSSAERRERAAQQLLRMSAAKRIGMTYVIEVDVTARSARQAATIANGITATYLAMQARTQGRSVRQAADWLDQQLETLRQQALSADEAVQSFKAAHGMIDTDQGSLDKEQVATLDNELMAATSRTAQAQARVDRLSVVGGDAANTGSIDLTQDPVLAALQQRYFEVSQREVELAARYGATHAVVLKLRGQMAALQGSIHQEVARISAAARTDLAIARTGEATIRSELSALIGHNGMAGAARAKLRSLESSAAIYRAVYTSSLQHYTQSMQDSSFPVVAAHVVTAAEPPLAKSKPRKLYVLAAAIVMGVGSGMSLALLLEFLDQTLTSAGQVERALGIACIARLPRVRLRGNAVHRAVAPTMITSILPRTRFADQVRRMRLRVLQHLGEQRAGIIGVVASRRGDGASTVAHNLSAALTASGRSVALVSLGQSRPFGLAGTHQRASTTKALAVVDMRSERGSDLIRKLVDLRQMHDIVVLDLPPFFELDEADEIIRVLDSTVLVARAGATSARDLVDLVDGGGVSWPCVAGVALNFSEVEIVRELER